MAGTLVVEQDGQRIEVVRHKPKYTHLRVPSSDPTRDPYDVVVDGTGDRCTCKGRLFRPTCRHGRLAQRLVHQTG